MAAVETRVCETDGCSSEAKLQCPTCIKLGIQGSYFCSQVDARLAPARRRRTLPLPSPPALAAGLDAPLLVPGRALLLRVLLPRFAAPAPTSRCRGAWALRD